MLASLVVRYSRILRIHVVLRGCMALTAVSLIVHSVSQIDLIMNYRPPRTLAWIPIYIAVNLTIWTAWITSHLRKHDLNKNHVIDAMKN